jgi:hypothetical protein
MSRHGILPVAIPALFAACLTGGCAVWAESVTGSGNAATEERELDAISEVVFHGAGTLEINRGELPGLMVTADDNVLPYLETRTASGKLTIQTRSGISCRPGLQSGTASYCPRSTV